jgi:hypothetical protein
MELEKEEIIFFVDNHKPGRGKRMASWHFPLLEKRRAIPPPPVRQLPPVPEMVLPPSFQSPSSSWEPRTGYPRFPIDPDDFN